MKMLIVSLIFILVLVNNILAQEYNVKFELFQVYTYNLNDFYHAKLIDTTIKFDRSTGKIQIYFKTNDDKLSSDDDTDIIKKGTCHYDTKFYQNGFKMGIKIKNNDIGTYKQLEKNAILNPFWKIFKSKGNEWTPIDSGSGIYSDNGHFYNKSFCFFCLADEYSLTDEYNGRMPINLKCLKKYKLEFTIFKEPHTEEEINAYERAMNVIAEKIAYKQKEDSLNLIRIQELKDKEEREQQQFDKFKNSNYNGQLFICEKVTDKGNPIGEAKVFPFNPITGNDIYFLVRLDEPLDCDTLEFDIVNTSTTYHFVEQYEKGGLYGKKWFYFDLHILLAGKYVFDITDCSKNRLLIRKTIFTIF
jgi:hypothetical protein